MAEGIKIEIVSPERLLLAEQATSATVPGVEGYFTVMGEHAPVLTILKPGFVVVETGNNKKTIYVEGGFADVSPEGLTILAENARMASDFDRAEIEAKLAEAQKLASAADSIADKDAAQLVVDSLINLMAEAEHMGPALVTAL